MPIIQPPFVNYQYYHIYNRGIAKQDLFLETQDYCRFYQTLCFYIDNAVLNKFSRLPFDQRISIINVIPRNPLVEILANCLMPNHFHLLVRQVSNKGISDYLRRALNSYTRYFNTKYKRIGTIFQGTFRAVAIESDEQLLHLSRYIHINPYMAKLIGDPSKYRWSSYQNYFHNISDRLCNPRLILEMIGTPENYKLFVNDYAEYIISFSENKKLFIDLE